MRAVYSLRKFLVAVVVAAGCHAEVGTIELWPEGQMPGPARELGPERDFTKPEDRLIAGRRIIKLGNVSAPEIHVYHPRDPKQGRGALVVAPGGGFSILAWDLEGTEVAEWCNGIGLTAAVLKYRVPTREIDPRWLLPVQDFQRAMSLVRSQADDWGVDKAKVGAMGFSAGGHAAVRMSYGLDRQYEPVDEADAEPFMPDYTMPIYTGGAADAERFELSEGIVVDGNSPPAFIVHAFDDGVPVEHALVLLAALKKADVASELHVYDAGGHGYGLRRNWEFPVTQWPEPAEDWLRKNGWID